MNMATDEEIRALCARVVAAQGSKEFDAAVTDLQLAIEQHLADQNGSNLKEN